MVVAAEAEAQPLLQASRLLVQILVLAVDDWVGLGWVHGNES